MDPQIRTMRRPFLLVAFALSWAVVRAQVDTVDVELARDTLRFNFGALEPTLALAKKEKKPIIMDFWADWCLPCKQMDRVTFSDPRVLERLRSEYVLHRVDVTEFTGMDVADARKVDKYPTILVLDPKGLELGRMVGFQSADSLLYKLEQFKPRPVAKKKGKR